MDALFSLILIIAAVLFSVLQIILFFKIWEMTNDIRDIRNSIIKNNKITNHSPSMSRKFAIGDLVVRISDEKQMRIKGITDEGKYICYSNGGIYHEGNYLDVELKMK